MMNRIEITNFSIEVSGPRTPALDALTQMFGKWDRKSGAYVFPKGIEQEVSEAVGAAPVTPAAPAAPMAPGWSNAAKRRAGSGARRHPLGEATYRGAGFTEYRDGLRGGAGVVQIWDES